MAKKTTRATGAKNTGKGKGSPRNTGNPPGRPAKLDNSPETLRQIRSLGGLGCTHEDCAAFFEVCNKTWFNFLNRCPAAVEAMEIGRGRQRISLRRKQIEVAMKDGHKGQPQMLIWLGKQMLGQKDVVEASGPGGASLVPEKITIEILPPRSPAAVAAAAKATVAAATTQAVAAATAPQATPGTPRH